MGFGQLLYLVMIGAAIYLFFLKPVFGIGHFEPEQNDGPPPPPDETNPYNEDNPIWGKQ